MFVCFFVCTVHVPNVVLSHLISRQICTEMAIKNCDAKSDSRDQGWSLSVLRSGLENYEFDKRCNTLKQLQLKPFIIQCLNCSHHIFQRQIYLYIFFVSGMCQDPKTIHPPLSIMQLDSVFSPHIQFLMPTFCSISASLS